MKNTVLIVLSLIISFAAKANTTGNDKDVAKKCSEVIKPGSDFKKALVGVELDFGNMMTSAADFSLNRAPARSALGRLMNKPEPKISAHKCVIKTSAGNKKIGKRVVGEIDFTSQAGGGVGFYMIFIAKESGNSIDLFCDTLAGAAEASDGTKLVTAGEMIELLEANNIKCTYKPLDLEEAKLKQQKTAPPTVPAPEVAI
jgi:hypothetical protein